jgi:hypothetical protein
VTRPTDPRFVQLAEAFFEDRLAPRLLLELSSGRVKNAQRLLTEREARDVERRLREAQRECAP